MRTCRNRNEGKPLHDPIVYEDGRERRSLDLRPDGITCIPLLGLSNFQMVRTGTEEHIHPGCVEVCLCLRGTLAFESGGMEYPFLPGTVFVSRPDEPHRMRHNPKGLMLYRILFRIPRRNERVLGLTVAESSWLTNGLEHFPVRLFPATERVRSAFERLFAIYDAEPRGTLSRRLKMKSAVLELLLALVEAPHAPASPKGRPNPKVKEIVRQLRAHPEECRPVDSLARESALSTVAFTEAVRRETGLPPHAFMLDCRVKAARRELAKPGTSVTSVARRYGFSSPQHFSTVFKHIFGITPRQVAKE